MNNHLERLRLATALCHSVPETELVLHRRHGGPLRVSRAPGADINPCQLRQIVGAHACPAGVASVSRVTSIELNGSLTNYGGDLYATSLGSGHQRWFVSFLHADHIRHILETVECPNEASEAISVNLNVDTVLGVTVVLLSIETSEFRDDLGRTATRAYRQAVIDELMFAPDPVDRRRGVERPVTLDLQGGVSGRRRQSGAQ